MFLVNNNEDSIPDEDVTHRGTTSDDVYRKRNAFTQTQREREKKEPSSNK